jgi:hypothetical protein
MAAADFIACSAPPGYVMLTSLKDTRHFPDGSSCYCNSCHKITLCLHCSLVHQALHVNPMVSSQGSEGATLLGFHVQSICCQRFHPNTHTQHYYSVLGRHHAGTTFHDGLTKAPLPAARVRSLGEMLSKCHQ